MKSGRDRIDKIREGQQRAFEERRKLLERMKGKQAAAQAERDGAARALKARAERFKFVDVSKTLQAAGQLRFWDLERRLAGSGYQLNRPTLELVGHFLRVLRQDLSASVLQWPFGQRDISLLHPISMLSVMASSPEVVSGGYNWCPAVPDFRTLYFPWRGTATGSNIRDLVVNRNELVERNKFHLTRPMVGVDEASQQMASLHKTVGNLNTLKQRDLTKPHLAHPSLYEVYPMFGALGGDDAPAPFSQAINVLYGRVAYGAGLTQLTDYRPVLTQPATAPFGFFGVCPKANFKRTLSHAHLSDAPGEGKSPDICILDLGPPGMARLGLAWEDTVAEFIDELNRTLPGTPILAITHDIYVHRRVHAFLKKRVEATEGHVGSSIVVRSSDYPLTEDPAVGAVSAVEFAFCSTGGDGTAAIRAMADAARALSDPSLAGNIRRKIGDLRRAMSLPCGLQTAYAFLEQVEGQAAAEDFLQHRSEAGIIAILRQSAEVCERDSERMGIRSAEAAVNLAFKGFEADTPIGSMLAELAMGLVRKSTRTLIAFATERDRRLGEFRIAGTDAAGLAVRRRMEDGHIRITTVIELERGLNEIQKSHLRDYWRRLIVVSPTQEQLSVILGKKWLPAEITVVCDREFVTRLASTYRSLSQHSDLAGPDRIGSRLTAAAKAAQAEAEARLVPAIDLELISHRDADRDEEVIDLVNSGEDDEAGEIVELTLESGRKMRARAGTLVIRHNAEAEVNPFDRLSARDVRVGHTIVVPNSAFLADARALLPVKVLAQGWVSIYHSMVEAALPGLPGDTLAAKARHIQQSVGKASVRHLSSQAVVDWLKVAEHKKVAAEVLRPHAPQRRRDYNAFAAVVGIPPEMAEKIWREGIEPLRIDRRRAGARMAQAFVSVLVDPHGSSAKLTPEIREKIGELRKRAREHLDGVLLTKTYELAGRVAT